MKINKVVCLIALQLISVSLFSQNQIITLKDGTVYEGFISGQNYTTGRCEISYSRMTKTIPTEDVFGKRIEKRAFQSLSAEWQNWAVENNKVEIIGNEKYLSLATMTIKNQQSRDYYILVSGTKYLSVFTISNGTETCKTSDIQSIRKEERDKALLTDIDDILQTDNATYTGVLLEQIPGESFTIWNKSDNSVHMVDYADVRSVGKSRFNQDYSIWKQTPWLDRIHLRNRTTGDGLVIENGFSKDMNILFAEKSGDGMDTRQYRFADVVSIERIKNPDYQPLYDVVLSEGESRINRDSTISEVETIMLLNQDSIKFFVIDPDKFNLVAQVGSAEVTVETNISGVADVYIAKAMKLKNIPLSLIGKQSEDDDQSSAKKTKKFKKSKQQEPVNLIDLYAYTYSTLFESEIDADTSTSINGTTKIVFTLPDTGIYFVYLRRLGICWAINYVKE